MGLIMKNGIQYPGNVSSGGGSALPQDMNYCYCSFPYDVSSGIITGNLNTPIVFEENLLNNLTCENGKVFLTKNKSYLISYTAQATLNGGQYVSIQNSDNSILNQNGTNYSYSPLSASIIYRCEKENDYVYLSCIDENVNTGTLRKHNLSFSVIELTEGITLNSGGSYTLPIDSAETLGGIKVGENLTITEDGTLNAEASGSAILSPGAVIYDEQERIIGRWSDGRPIYQKTVTTTEMVICNYIDYINVPCSNLPVNIDILLCCKISEDFHSFYMTVAKIDSDNVLKIWSSAPQGSLGLNAGTYITLQYTKTTDEPNSFRPDMIENISIMRNLDFSNIYTEEERIIGCWIDGRPIYQKTWTINMGSSNWTKTQNITNEDFQMINEILKAETYDTDSTTPRHVICSSKKMSNTVIRFYTIEEMASIDHYTLMYTKTTDEENSFTPDMIIDHENITDAEIEAAAAADKI